MGKKEFIISMIVLAVTIFLLSLAGTFTGRAIIQTDEFSHVKEPHWTHMPVTYSISGECTEEPAIRNAFKIIENSTDSVVNFKEIKDNNKNTESDIKILCSFVENCYEKKQETRWFWIITTEAICEHEAGEAQIKRLRGNKILQAEINLKQIPEIQENCSEVVIHELLHTFNYEHSENPESIMYPARNKEICNENIDPWVSLDLIEKYKR